MVSLVSKQGASAYFLLARYTHCSTLKMEAVCSSEIWAKLSARLQGVTLWRKLLLFCNHLSMTLGSRWTYQLNNFARQI
jgi:hypothetical protein